LGLGISLVLAVTVASVASVALDRYVIAPLGLGHLRTMVLVSVVAGSSVLALRLMPGAPARRGGAQAGSPAVLVGNCAVFAAALLAVERQYSLIVTLVYALAAGLGVLAVTAAMAGLRSRAELGPVPAAFRGLPVGLLTGGLAALAFMGFIGMGSR
jgi:electron transport complex protein RnfA